jgi:hypothetical protein
MDELMAAFVAWLREQPGVTGVDDMQGLDDNPVVRRMTGLTDDDPPDALIHAGHWYAGVLHEGLPISVEFSVTQ